MTTSILVLVGGCAVPSVAPPVSSVGAQPRKTPAECIYATIPSDNPAADWEIVTWLRHDHVRIEKDPNGDDRIYDSPACRKGLGRCRRLLRLRLNIIAQNLVNMNTTRDGSAARTPYQRKWVRIDPEGEPTICADQSPFLKRYQPGHPDADAGGYVLYPNVEPSVEYVNAQVASMEYRMAVKILRQFDPTVVDVSDAYEVFRESPWQSYERAAKSPAP